MRTLEHTEVGAAPAAPPAISLFHPRATIKCRGSAMFRSQVARDVACLLDVDTAVSSWQCQPLVSQGRSADGTPDFLVTYEGGGSRYLDAPDRPRPDLKFVQNLDCEHLQLTHEEVYDGLRLQNARDLLRYGNWKTPLGDRVRLLAALDEHGTLTLAECLGAFQETRPVAGIASLILTGFVEVDLDAAPLGPETQVRRIRR